MGSVRGMEKELHNTTKIRDQIDAHVGHITAWTTLLGALEQKSPEILEIPTSTMGEVARSIQKSAVMIRELVDSLTATNVSK